MEAVGADAQGAGYSLARPPLKKLNRGGNQTSGANAPSHDQILLLAAGLDAVVGRVFAASPGKHEDVRILG